MLELALGLVKHMAGELGAVAFVLGKSLLVGHLGLEQGAGDGLFGGVGHGCNWSHLGWWCQRQEEWAALLVVLEDEVHAHGLRWN
ncbi:hypothetical protein ACFL6C_08160 [Myxococcota bacterium]